MFERLCRWVAVFVKSDILGFNLYFHNAVLQGRRQRTRLVYQGPSTWKLKVSLSRVENCQQLCSAFLPRGSSSFAKLLHLSAWATSDECFGGKEAQLLGSLLSASFPSRIMDSQLLVTWVAWTPFGFSSPWDWQNLYSVLWPFITSFGWASQPFCPHLLWTDKCLEGKHDVIFGLL